MKTATRFAVEVEYYDFVMEINGTRIGLTCDTFEEAQKWAEIAYKDVLATDGQEVKSVNIIPR